MEEEIIIIQQRRQRMAKKTVLLTVLVSTCIAIGSLNDGFVRLFLQRHGGEERQLTEVFNEDEDIPSLFPLVPLDYIGFACTILGLMLAAGAGIGGGGILVPIYILIFDFPVKHAISLASVTIFGGAIANNILNARKHHPDHPSRPAIDWDLIIQLEPMAMAGALIGAHLNHLLPDVLLVILLFLLLSLTAYKTLLQAIDSYEKENNDKLAQTAEQGEKIDSRRLLDQENKLVGEEDVSSPPCYGSLEATSASSDTSDHSRTQNGDNSGTVTMETANKNDRLMRSRLFLESDHQPSFGASQTNQASVNALKLTGLFVIVTLLNIAKGGPGEGSPLSIANFHSCGKSCFWTTEVFMIFIILLFAVHVRSSILKRYAGIGGPVLSDIEWNRENTIAYPIYAIVAGLVAGLFGVGGGIIKGPLMLALGVHPAVASATSACMILFTSCIATVSYMMFDLLIYDYAAGCLSIGFVATLLGQTLMAMVMARYNRHSYIAFTIGLVVAISAVAMTIEAVIAMLES